MPGTWISIYRSLGPFPPTPAPARARARKSSAGIQAVGEWKELGMQDLVPDSLRTSRSGAWAGLDEILESAIVAAPQPAVGRS